MIRIAIGLFIAWMLLVGTIPAQLPDNFYVHGYVRGPTTQWVIYEVSGAGNVVSTLTRLPSKLPSFLFVYRMAMDEHNQSIRILGDFPGSPPKPVLLDVDQTGKITTLHAGWPLGRGLAMDPAPDGYGWIIAQRASIFGLGDPFQCCRYYNGKMTSLAIGVGLTALGSGFNLETGKALIRAQQVSPVFTNGYFEFDPFTGSFSTLAVGSANYLWINHGVDHVPYEGHNGTYVDTVKAAPSKPIRLVRIVPGSGIIQFPKQGVSGTPYDLIPSTHEAQGIAYLMLNATGSSKTGMALTLLAADGTNLGIIPMPSIVVSGSDLVMKGGRSLAWIMNIAPNERSLNLCFPRHPGKDYVVGLSLSGVRPNPALPDGRRIPLQVDALTQLCATGGIPPVLTGTVGKLNGIGRGQVRLRLNGFQLSGVRIWAAAVILDRKAPSGVAQIAGPLLTILQ